MHLARLQLHVPSNDTISAADALLSSLRPTQLLLDVLRLLGGRQLAECQDALYFHVRIELDQPQTVQRNLHPRSKRTSEWVGARVQLKRKKRTETPGAARVGLLARKWH